MSKPPILQEGQSYTFRSYFEMPYEPDEILAELGYALVRSLTKPSLLYYWLVIITHILLKNDLLTKEG